MKLRVEAGALADALSWMLPAVPRNSGVPILHGVLLVAGEDLLAEVTGDHAAMRAKVHAIIDEPGSVVVPARVLAAIVASLRGEVILTAKGQMLHLQCGRSKYDFRLMPTEEYPRASFEAAEKGTVDAGVLYDGLKLVEHALGSEDVLAVLAAIHFEATGDGVMVLAATDRYRMARAEVPWRGQPLDINPAGKHIIDIAKGLRDLVTISFSEGYMLIGDAERTALMRIHGEQFPRVDGMIAQSSAYDVSVNAHDLLSSLQRLTQVVDTKNPIVVLTFDPDGSCQIRSDEGQDGRYDGVEVIDCTADVTVDLAFKAPYLMDAVKAHGSERIRFYGAKVARTSPPVVAGNKQLTTVIMQIRPAAERAS